MFRVVLLRPLYAGNVGAVARAMANFGLDRLELVDPPPVTLETRMFAVHAFSIVEKAPVRASLDEAIAGVDLVVGFSSTTAASGQHHHRTAIALSDLRRRLDDVDGEVALVFGREDTGLGNDELERCDVIVQIPTSPAYASMNVSHAVAVALYELSRRDEWGPMRARLARHDDIGHMVRVVEHLLRTVGTPEYRIHATAVALRRLVGRAPMTTWEYHRVMGIFSAALKQMGAWPPP